MYGSHHSSKLRADLARAYTALGDAERALPLAECAFELARALVPTAVSLAQVARAEALLAARDHAGARAALEGIDVERLPEPDRTFAFVRSRLTESRMALALGDPGGAAATATGVVRHLRSRKVRILVAEALVAVAKARIEQGRFEEAESELTDAITKAEQLGERMALWEALALQAQVRDRRGAGDEAGELRRRAQTVVDEIAGGSPRTSFEIGSSPRRSRSCGSPWGRPDA